MVWPHNKQQGPQMCCHGPALIYTLLRQRHLHWLGHIHRRMQDGTEDPQGPAAGLIGELTIGKRAQGHHQLQFKDVFKKDM